ncbi:MAG: hypothetical protein PUP93_19810, partial [Rhizonema sp. NSF051]|nr:hypothetical protein [Rhizonema sp. NSF051]
LYTFGENLEILSYLYWPGLVILGMAFKREDQTHISLSRHKGCNIYLESELPKKSNYIGNDDQ